MAPTPRPRLFLDIDGVINAPHPPWLSTTTFTVTDNQGAGYAVNYTITVAPAMVAEIDQLRADFDLELTIVSTWLENPAMVSDLTKALGALHRPRLLAIPPRKLGGYRSSLWKREAVLEDLSQNPPSAFVWIDDDETPVQGNFVRRAYDLPALMIGPDPEHGLTAGDLAAIRSLLEGLRSTRRHCRAQPGLEYEVLARSSVREPWRSVTGGDSP